MRQTNVRGSLSLRGFRKLRTGAIVATGVILLGLGFLAPTVSASEQDGVWVARTVEEVKADIQNIDNLSHYTIRWGDTLSAISGATDISVDSLVEINRIANRDLIFANNKLYFSEEAFLKDGDTEVRRQRVSIDNSGSRQSYEVETKTDTVTGEQTTTVKQTTPVVSAPTSETPVSDAPKAKTRSETLNAPSADTTNESANSTESSPVTDKAPSNIGTTNQAVASNPSSEVPAPKAEEPMVSEPKAEEPAAPAPKVEEAVSPAPTVEEPTVSEPKAEAPVATRPTTEEPVTPKGEVAAVPQKEVQTVFKSEVSQASAGNVLVGIKGEFLTPDQQAILDSLNKIRKEAFEEKLVDKYVPIKWSTQLEKTALMRAAESSITNAHARLSNKDIWTAFPTGTRAFGENLAWNYKGFAEAIEQWYSEKADYIKESKGETVAGQTGHYKSLINPLYTYTGLGAFNNPRHEHHWITVAQILGDKVDSEALVGQYGLAIQESEVTESQLASLKTKADIVENISKEVTNSKDVNSQEATSETRDVTSYGNGVTEEAKPVSSTSESNEDGNSGDSTSSVSTSNGESGKETSGVATVESSSNDASSSVNTHPEAKPSESNEDSAKVDKEETVANTEALESHKENKISEIQQSSLSPEEKQSALAKVDEFTEKALKSIKVASTSEEQAKAVDQYEEDLLTINVPDVEYPETDFNKPIESHAGGTTIDENSTVANSALTSSNLSSQSSSSGDSSQTQPVATSDTSTTGHSGFRRAGTYQPRVTRRRRSIEEPQNVDVKKEELRKRGYTLKQDYVYQANGKDYNYVVTFSKAIK